MEAAQGGDCPDFEVPSSLPSLSAYHGEHTASSSSSCSSSYSCGSSLFVLHPSYGGSDNSSSDSNQGSYAPGVGQKPAPSPTPNPTPAPPAAPPAAPPSSGGVNPG